MTSKSKSKQEEALQFLDALDSFTPGAGVEGTRANHSNAGGPPEGEAAEVLAFLDEITQKSSEPTHARLPTPSGVAHIDRPSRAGTPSLRKAAERVRLGGGGSASSSTTSLHKANNNAHGNVDNKAVLSDQTTKQNDANADEGGGDSGLGSWAWGSVWSTASAAIKQAKSAVDEQVKALPNNEQARKWGEGVIEYARQAQLEKIGKDFKRVGLSTLNDLLNVVAPPISEHEVIRVWLSHDMQGYDGVESLTYKSLARIMEQVDGGDLVVNRGNESRPKDGSSKERDLNTVDGYEAALKLAEANVEEMLKANTKLSKDKASMVTVPTIYSDVYIRIQPFFTEYNISSSSEAAEEILLFLVYLSDPEHQLVHTTLSQAIPQRWLNMWDRYDWVEELVAESLRIGVEVIGQEYIVSRMGWSGQRTEEQEQEQEQQGEQEQESKEADAS